MAQQESPSSSKKLPLHRGRIGYESAIAREDDVLLQLSYPKQRFDFFVHLYSHSSSIISIVSQHLQLSKHQTCRLGEVKEWIHGSFNVCIPVYIHNWSKSTHVLIRFPLPYNLGDDKCPDNAGEKLRCEAATFLWIRENCPALMGETWKLQPWLNGCII